MPDLVNESAKDAAARLTAFAQREGFKPVAMYPYKDKDGKAQFVRLRLEKPNGEKRIYPMSRNGKGWKLKEPDFPSGKKPLYKLPEITNNPEATAWIVEGENKVDALSKLGIIATTSGSSSGAAKADWTPLNGRTVVTWPDNDAPGAKYADAVTEILLDLQCQVERIDVSKLGLPDKGDAVDYFQDNPATTKEDIENLPRIKAKVKNEDKTTIDTEWPEPEPIPDALLPVSTFDKKLLPEPYRAWVADIADRMQCPIDYPAIASIVMTASVIGRRIGIYPKALDNWLAVPNLWGCIVGQPGKLKTHAANEVFKPLNRLAETARKDHEAATSEHKAELEVLKARGEGISIDLRKAVKTDNETEIGSLKAQLVSLDNERQTAEPPEKRYLIHDTTVEKLGILLEANPQGVLVYRDEIAGFFANLDKQGHETDRTFYLESWDGNGSFSYDRIGREKVYIKHACISLFGTIQPGKLLTYLNGALNGYTDDGLFQRLQVIVYPDKPKTWLYRDRAPDAQAADRVNRLIEALDRGAPGELGAFPIDGGDDHALRFMPEAQEYFISWLTDLENLLSRDDEHEALIAHLAKYRSLMPSLALIFHLVDVADGQTQPGNVSLEATQRAAAWTAYLESHARRIYGMALNAELGAARLLIEKVKAGKLDNEFKARDVRLKGWTGLNTPDKAQAACDTAVDYGWLRSIAVDHNGTGGRPTVIYIVNPRLARSR